MPMTGSKMWHASVCKSAPTIEDTSLNLSLCASPAKKTRRIISDSARDAPRFVTEITLSWRWEPRQIFVAIAAIRCFQHRANSVREKRPKTKTIAIRTISMVCSAFATNPMTNSLQWSSVYCAPIGFISRVLAPRTIQPITIRISSVPLASLGIPVMEGITAPTQSVVDFLENVGKRAGMCVCVKKRRNCFFFCRKLFVVAVVPHLINRVNTLIQYLTRGVSALLG